MPVSLAVLVFAPIIQSGSMLQQLPESDGQILLVDCYRFGVSREMARAETNRSLRHVELMRNEIAAWNTPAAYAEWVAECSWRHQCWTTLWDAVNPDYSPGWYWSAARQQHESRPSHFFRLKRLYQLRDLIGQEAFEAGVMPSPIPIHYRR